MGWTEKTRPPDFGPGAFFVVLGESMYPNRGPRSVFKRRERA